LPIKEVTGQAITRRQQSCINWKRFCREKLGIFKFVYSRVRSLDRDLEVLSKEEIHMELSFIPNFWLFSSSRMVRVQLHIERFPFDKNRIGSIAPNITFFPVFSDDSPQFACARQGDIDGLIGLLRSGKASLADRDDQGETLLDVGPPI
jgi:hypothetical protein